MPVCLAGAGAVYVNRRLCPRGNDVELLPEDEILPGVDISETHETELDAFGSAMLPWLVQMGCGRGGFYSFDVLVRLAGVGIINVDDQPGVAEPYRGRLGAFGRRGCP